MPFRTPGDEVARLRKRGFIAFEVEGIVGRLTKKQSHEANIAKRVLPIVILATVYARHARRRALEGRFPHGPYQYDQTKAKTRDGKYVVGTAYANRLGVEPVFDSSSEFHRRIAATPGKATGGLMDAWQSRGVGKDAARIDARGQSIGSSTRLTTVLRGRKGKKRYVKKLRGLVRNQIKAGSVFRHLGLNIFQPTEAELEAMGDAAAYAGLLEMDAAMDMRGRGAKITASKLAPRERALYATLVRRWVRRGV